MGTRSLPRLTDAEVCQRYLEGDSQGLIGLKARLSTAQVRAILVAHGVRLRGQQESLRLALRARPFDSTTRMRQRTRRG